MSRQQLRERRDKGGGEKVKNRGIEMEETERKKLEEQGRKVETKRWKGEREEKEA